MSLSASSQTTSARILLIDDNKLGLAARKAVLRELGYRITTATGPDEGLKKFSETKFDLIVTDFKMPGMNGIELIRKFREREPDVPVILLSGFADALGLDEKNTGADLVIQKSASEVPNMVRAVGRLLRRAAAKKPAASHRPVARAKRKSS